MRREDIIPVLHVYREDDHIDRLLSTLYSTLIFSALCTALAIGIDIRVPCIPQVVSQTIDF